ncbi:MAG TPA: C/D box methylation guide ribonucleoprotein complex aNOP56 subunit, partial [Thermococcus paralvinellae]|nr:C/D box methylation guide ribonucleoprotein complex aNOP56 subunit [Thermococcus paralvinellae]
MKAYISENVQGIYAFDEDGNLIAKREYREKPEVALDKLLSGEITDDLMIFLKELKERGYKEYIFEHPDLSRAVKELGFNADAEFPNLAGEILRERPKEFLGEQWFDRYYSVGLDLTRLRIQEQSGARDKMVIQAIEALDDIDKVINLLVSRLREWYSLHFPELDEILPKHPQYVTFVKNIGHRDNATKENLEKLGFSEGKIEKILRAKEKTMGAWMDERDIRIIQNFAKEIDDLYRLREEIEDYIDRAMDDVAP